MTDYDKWIKEYNFKNEWRRDLPRELFLNLTDFGRRVVYLLEEEIPFRGDTVQLETSAMFVFEDDFDDEGCPAQYSYLFEFRLYAYDDFDENYNIDVTDTLTADENLEMQKQIDELAADAAAYAAERKAER